MNKFFDLLKGFAERLTLRIVSLVATPGLEKQDLENVKNAFNQKNQDLEAAIEDLKSKDPNKASSYIDFLALFKKVKPFIIIALILIAGNLALKFFNEIKKR